MCVLQGAHKAAIILWDSIKTRKINQPPFLLAKKLILKASFPQRWWEGIYIKNDEEKLMLNKKAFTLIEMLVVVIIIGILAAIALPQYRKAVMKTRFTEMIAVAKGITEARRMYFLENGVTNDMLTDLYVDGFTNCNVAGGTPGNMVSQCYMGKFRITNASSYIQFIYPSDSSIPMLQVQWQTGIAICAGSSSEPKKEAFCKSYGTVQQAGQPQGYYIIENLRL
jgi:prepilin-type N-terminal cleavage/methylation domain-containing protein